MASADSALRSDLLRAEMNSPGAESTLACPSPALLESVLYPGKYTQKQDFPVPVFPG